MVPLGVGTGERWGQGKLERVFGADHGERRRNYAAQHVWAVSRLLWSMRRVTLPAYTFLRNYQVRNPWSRAISNYNYLLGKMNDAPQCKGVDWNTFCRDPFSVSNLCKEHPECAVARAAGEMAAHVHRQAACMVDASGDYIVDYIARTEILESDLAAVVDKINSRRAAGLPPIVLKPMKVINPTNVCSEEPVPQAKYVVNGTEVALQIPREQYCNASQYYGSRHPHCLGAVAAHYLTDLSILY